MDRLKTHLENIQKAAAYIGKKLPEIPKTAMILGSGLGTFADAAENKVVIDYADIPGFPQATAPSHKGRLVYGRFGSVFTLFMQGRFHCYEGHDVLDTVLPVRVFASLGIENLFITNAAGGINPAYSKGALMLIRDHIGFFAPPVLWGQNAKDFGVRFPDMTFAYSPALVETARDAARKTGVELFEGVYGYTKGAQYETPAEIHALRRLGADAAGMSTVPEVVAARHAGLQVVAVSCITNMAAGMEAVVLTEEDVLETSRKTAGNFMRFSIELLKNIN